MPPQESSDKEFIYVENLQKSFTMGSVVIEVLKKASFTVKRGEMVGIVGASGVGKSTLLHIIGTLDRPTSGKVYFEGIDVFSLKSGEIAEFRNQKVGFVFQFNQLLREFTAVENTAMPAWIHRKKRNEALRYAGHLLNEVGLGERLHHKPGELSGGEQQRVAIARSLMNNPAVVLADEPTGNLDSKTGGAIYDLLCRLNEEMNQTFVIVTHNDKLAGKMNRIIRIADGKLLNC